MHEFFRRFAHSASRASGSVWAFLLAVLTLVIWAVTGPLFDFSDTWQLVINTGTTIVTFLMVFLIQNTQNRDAMAMHLKLDELLRAVAKARTGLVELEELSDAELETLHKEFAMLHQAGRLTRKKQLEAEDRVNLGVAHATKPAESQAPPRGKKKAKRMRKKR